ncbi:MAG TPA: DUF5668 domain-containing protein [Thermoanaerobaculia bacterium]|jgi:hypothetical protein
MERDNLWARLVAGTAILAVGVIVWLDHLHKLHAADYLRWWPLALIALGLAHLLERRWVGASLLILLGLGCLPRLPFLPHFNMAQIFAVWPLLISVGGMTLVMQALRPAAKDASRAGAFRAIAVMGGGGRTIGSDQFVGGDVVAVMGGCEIDLSSANIARDAVIDVLAFWGGLEIKVPRGWRIENRVAVILGALVDKTSGPASADAPRLVVRGAVIMGGIEVRNPREET